MLGFAVGLETVALLKPVAGDQAYVTPATAVMPIFKLTAITPKSFTCENPQHDFPKKITYVLSGTQLKATISGNGKSFDYLYEKKN